VPRLVELPGELVLFLLGQRLAGLDLGKDGVGVGLLLNGLLPVGDVVALVYALAVGTDFDVVNGVQPFVLEAELLQLGSARPGSSRPATTPAASAGEDVGVESLKYSWLRKKS
jgi:hypothetical protein